MEDKEIAGDVEQANPEAVEAVLAELVAAARSAFADELVSVLLFGSAAEGRLRPTSDVNLLFLLKTFDPARADALRESLRAAHAAMQAQAMFLLVEELPVAAELFAVKFHDIRGRHRVLFGADPVRDLAIDEAELRRRLREVLLNLSIRLRERYTLISLREEQLARVVAGLAGPLRASAAALLRLQGRQAGSPREALETVASATGDAAFIDAVALLPQARQQDRLPAGAGGTALLALGRLATHLRVGLEDARQS